MGPSDVYVGLDLGTSGLKGVAVGSSGAVLGFASSGYPTHRPAAGAYEQDTGDWLRAVSLVVARLGALVPFGRWRAVGLSGMIPTLVTIGADGRAVGRAVTWQDSRADAVGESFRSRCGEWELYRLTGQWVDGRYLVPMFGRLARDSASRAGATRVIASAKDYLFAFLTGELATDPSTASGYGCYELEAGRWNTEFSDGLPGLPEVRPSVTWRPLRASVAERLGCGRIPVVLGAADSVLGALGLGVREPGQVAYIAGTSTVILGVAERLVLDPSHRFLVTPLAADGRWGVEMDLLATGSAMEWLAGVLGLGEAHLVELAAVTDPFRSPVLLSYLSPGEQGALWDPSLHGAIVGLDLGHGREHLARALVNGIVLESRRCLEVLDSALRRAGPVAVGGGSASGASFRGDLADATRRAVSVQDDGDMSGCSARGAALIAALAVDGEFPAAVPHAGVAEPDESRAQSWDVLWAAHEAARLGLTRWRR